MLWVSLFKRVGDSYEISLMFQTLYVSIESLKFIRIVIYS